VSARRLAFAIGISLWLVAGIGTAHEFRMAALSLLEVSPGRFMVRWTRPSLGPDQALEVVPRFPAACRSGREHVDCGRAGLVGEVSFPELRGTIYRVAVRIEWLGGARMDAIADGSDPVVRVRGTPRGASPAELWPIVKDYTRLGVEHVLGGLDHLLFVLGLVLLVGYRRLLIWTITAFTLAHSLTLALSVFGSLSLPPAPVEAAIALSILLLARECAVPGVTLTRRYPWLVAFGFGLFHGFGFAGALTGIGLPPQQAPLSLIGFNLGVELGQLLAIGSAWLISRLAMRRLASAEHWTRAMQYGLGTAAACWTIERVLALFA
jgi:hydrogenase/urease accessory protein HupE